MNADRGENVTMIRLSIRIKEVSFRVFLCVLWLIPVFVILCWNPYFPLPVKAIEAAELSENQGQSQPALEDSQINVHDVSVEYPLPQPLVIDDGPEGLLLKSQVKANFFGKSKPEIDIFQKKRSEIENPLFSSNLASNEPDRQLEIFRLKQKFNSFNCGMEYRYVGKNLNNPKDYKKKTKTKTNADFKSDQEGLEIWGEKKFGPIGLKSFFSRFYDNVDCNPKQTRMLNKEYGLEMKYKMDSLPIYFSVSHSRGKSESTIEPDSSEYQGKQKKTYGGSLYYYGGKAFNMTASSSYSPNQDLVDQNKVTESFWHEISATVRPTSYITITPTISYGEYRYLWYGERTENPSASLSVSLSKLFKTVDIYFWESYSGMRGTDGYQDDMMFNTALGISWKAKYFTSLPKMKFSIGLEHYTYIDKIYSESFSNDMRTSFSVKFPF